jgi:hypothetical protein
MALNTAKKISDVNRMNRASQNGALGTVISSLEATQPFAKETAQLLVADGAITVKNGVCKIAKTVAGAVAATLANPIDVTDDYKELLIINFQAQLNTVTCTGGFGNGGTSYDVATFAAAVGQTLKLQAFGGKWYIIGNNGATIA